VFGIGLNYRDHAAESGLPVPAGEPPVFTKFPSCITGPHGDIELPPGTPAGVGLGRDPQRWLADGDVLTSHIEGIGEMRHRFVAAPPVRKEY
jgi:2-keto-4-pentenoate hydratase/2-oxohepta-3-ene-1,7-dioic acid hydratase in catechol pathway